VKRLNLVTALIPLATPSRETHISPRIQRITGQTYLFQFAEFLANLSGASLMQGAAWLALVSVDPRGPKYMGFNDDRKK